MALVAAGWMCGFGYLKKKKLGRGGPYREVAMLLLLVGVVVELCRFYDRFLLPSRFLKLEGLIFISANSIECSWPFQWNQFTPWGRGYGKLYF